MEISGSRVWNFAGAFLGAVLVPLVAAIANDRELIRQANPDHIAGRAFPKFLVGGVIAGFVLGLTHVVLLSAKVKFG